MPPSSSNDSNHESSMMEQDTDATMKIGTRTSTVGSGGVAHQVKEVKNTSAPAGNTATNNTGNATGELPPPKKKRRKKTNERVPPYKTFQVIKDATSLEVVRTVTQFDVICLDHGITIFNPQNYDFFLQPGNTKLRKLVTLSQANYDKLLLEQGDDPMLQEEEGAVAMSRSIVETIRNDWNGFFLKQALPNDYTKWIDIGSDLSVQHVQGMFTNSIDDGNNDNSINQMKPPSGTTQQQQPQQPRQQQAPPVGQHQQQPVFLPQIFPGQPHMGVASADASPVAPLRLLANQAATCAMTSPGRPHFNVLGGTLSGTNMAHHSLAPLAANLPPMSPGLAFVRQQLDIFPMSPHVHKAQAQAIVRQTLQDGTVGTETTTNSQAGPTAAKLPPVEAQQKTQEQAQPVKRKRGRPRKNEVRPLAQPAAAGPKRKRGRPRKTEVQPLGVTTAPATASVAATKMSAAAIAAECRGRKKRIEVPDPRVAPSMVPLPASPALVGMGAGMASSSPAKLGAAFDESTLPKLHWKSYTQPPSLAERRQQPSQGQGIAQPPKSPVVSLEPQWGVPVPVTKGYREKEYPAVEEAKRLVSAHDKEWVSNYEKLRYTRITLYCNNNVARWSTGQLRHTMKKKNQSKDTTLNPWIAEQQRMYREFCQWEDHIRNRKTANGVQTQHLPKQQQAQQPPQIANTPAAVVNSNIPAATMAPGIPGVPGQFVLPSGAGSAPLPAAVSVLTPATGAPAPAMAPGTMPPPNAVPTMQQQKPAGQDKGECASDNQEKKQDSTTNTATNCTATNPHALLTTAATTSVMGQTEQSLRELQGAKILLMDSLHFVWHPNQEPPADAPEEWKESFFDLREYVRSRGDTVVPDTVELGVWCQLQRMKYQRALVTLERQQQDEVLAADGLFTFRPTPRQKLAVSVGQMRALRGLGFDWEDLESSDWHVMYMKLLEFRHATGDCLIPPPKCENVSWSDNEDNDSGEEDEPKFETPCDPKLYFWVQRQRFEYIRFQKVKEEADQRASRRASAAAAGVDEDGHELVEKLLEEEEAQRNGNHDHGCDEKDVATAIVDMVRTPKPDRRCRPKDGDKGNKEDNKENEGLTKNAARDSQAKKGKKKEKVIPSSDQVSTLTQAQIGALEMIGFIWDMDITNKWIDQYRRLQAFYLKHGHSKVTRTTNESKTKLNRWCSQMRRSKQISDTGGKHGLSHAKISLLDKLEFIWEFEDLPDRYGFDERYEWLKQYYEENGHCNVPQRHPTLGHFVKRLRKEYEAERKGVKDMNPEKKRKLDEINFKWRVRVVRGTRRRTKSIVHDDELGQQAAEDDCEDGEDEESGEEEDDDDDDDDDLVPCPVPQGGEHRNEAGRIVFHSPRTQYVPGNKSFASPNNRRSPGQYDLFGQPLQSASRRPAMAECDVCEARMAKISAQCGACHSAFCEGCYGDILHKHQQACPGCSGPVTRPGGGILI